MTIRRLNAQAADYIAEIEALVTIWFDASVLAHGFIDRAFWEGNKAAMRDVYLPASETWVTEDADNEGRVAGFLSIAGDAGDAGNAGETLAALFIRPECQGRGFGSRLLNHAKTLRNRLELSVYVENERACAFYRKHGFTAVSKRRDEHTGHAEYLMAWRATP